MGKKSNSNNLTFLEHLEELRWHLIKALLALIVCFIISMFFAGNIFEILKEPLLELEKENLIKLYSDRLQGPFVIYLKISLMSGLVLSFPIILFQLIRFILPALYKSEKRFMFIGLPFSVILFFAGTFISYKFVVPFAIRFFVMFNDYYLGIEMIVMVQNYFDLLLSMILLSGLVFQLPIVMSILARIGLISAEKLKKWRPIAIIVIMSVSAIITPPDPFSMIAFSIPLFLLYELSVLISKYIRKKYG